MKSFGFSLQSAMEYLMTYGWSILIIAIVLAALFSLGIFNSANFAPKAPTGSCHVFRPGGVLTTTNINLEGTCNNQLPMYAAQFNGASSAVTVASTTGMPLGSNPRSVFLWVNPSITDTGYHAPFAYGGASSSANALLIRLRNLGSGVVLEYNVGTGTIASSLLVPSGTWSFIGITYAGGSGTVTLYVDGQSQNMGTLTFTTTSQTLNIGDEIDGSPYPGQIANVQVYNISLDSGTVNALYAEGIGGAPPQPQYLVAWWPLNGDSNDYSGNGNSGVPTNVIFTSSWTNGYTTP